MGALVLQQKFQIAPQTQAPNIIWIQKKEAQINLTRDAPFPGPLRLSKSAGKRTPSRFPNRGPYEESCPSPRPPFLNRSPPNKKKKFHSKALWKQTAISRALFGISFGVPSKKSPPARGHAKICVKFPNTAKGKYCYSKTRHKIGNGRIDIHDNASSGGTDPYNIVCPSCRLACSI